MSIPLVEYAKSWPQTASETVQKAMKEVLDGSALAARVEKDGVWIFYEGGKYNVERVRDQQDQWAKIAGFRARDNCSTTVAKAFFTFEEMGDAFVQVGKMDAQSGKIYRFYEAIKFP